MDEWLVGGSTLESLELFLDTLTGESASLSSTDKFERLIESAPDPIHFLLYADIAGILEMVEDALSSDMKSDYRRNVRPFVESLSAFMIVSSITEERTQFTTILTVQE